MVKLYVGGHRIGSRVESDRAVLDITHKRQSFELHEEGGEIGHPIPFEPSPFSFRAEIDHRCAAGGGIPLSHFWNKMGVE